MTAPDLTLNKAIETAKVKVSRVSDFLTDEEIDKIHETNLKGKKRASFDEVDSYIAEIIARFGYETYLAWKLGEIDELDMVHYIQAERAREAQNRLRLENIIVTGVAGANQRTKTGHVPKSLKMAIKMLKSEEKLAKGVI